jgi:hypothetical protein
MSEFMMDLALGEQPEQIHRLLDFCRQVWLRYALAQIDRVRTHTPGNALRSNLLFCATTASTPGPM